MECVASPEVARRRLSLARIEEPPQPPVAGTVLASLMQSGSWLTTGSGSLLLPALSESHRLEVAFATGLVAGLAARLVPRTLLAIVASESS